MSNDETIRDAEALLAEAREGAPVEPRFLRMAQTLVEAACPYATIGGALYLDSLRSIGPAPRTIQAAESACICGKHKIKPEPGVTKRKATPEHVTLTVYYPNDDRPDCRACSGSGKTPSLCPACVGSGNGKVFLDGDLVICATCNGTGSDAKARAVARVASRDLGR